MQDNMKRFELRDKALKLAEQRYVIWDGEGGWVSTRHIRDLLDDVVDLVLEEQMQ